MAHEGQRSAAELAAQVISGAAREKDIRLLALMVLGRDRIVSIDSIMVAWWLFAHGWSLCEKQEGFHINVEPEPGSCDYVSLPLAIMNSKSTLRICASMTRHAAHIVARRMSRHRDDILAEWMSLTIDIESDKSAERDMANALEIALLTKSATGDP